MVVFRFLVVGLMAVFHAQAQTSSASWQFPVEDGLIINNIDTILLQWTSNFSAAYMEMWCQNDGDTGNNVILGSMFQVNTTGTYPYVIANDDPSQTTFPVACHAQLVDAPNGAGSGPDDPVGVTFVSLSGSPPPKTFSLASATQSSASTTTSSSSIITSSSSSSSAATSATSATPSSSLTSILPSNTSPSLPAATTSNSIISKDGLSTGAKIGIALAAVVVGLAIVGGGVWWIWRKRRQSSQAPAIPELEGKGDLGPYGDPRYGRHELQDAERRKFELAASGRDRPELEGQEMIFEMPANSPKLKSGAI